MKRSLRKSGDGVWSHGPWQRQLSSVTEASVAWSVQPGRGLEEVVAGIQRLGKAKHTPCFTESLVLHNGQRFQDEREGGKQTTEQAILKG